MSKKRIGMYGDTPKLKIGIYTICRMNPDGDDKTIWIESEDGEGAEFNADLFEATIDTFFNKYF